MAQMIGTFVFVLWYCIGIRSFKFWWLREFSEIGRYDRPLMFYMAFFGPFAWVMGYGIHGKRCGYNLLGLRLTK